jgi:nitrogen fixation NifU-like protein
MEAADRVATGDNPLCGDKIDVYVKLNGDVIEAVSFQGSGCAISQSSASLMTTSVIGKTVDEWLGLFSNFHEMVTGDADGPIDKEVLGKLRAFGGVREFPSRVKCANLSWHTLRAALDSATDAVTTE